MKNWDDDDFEPVMTVTQSNPSCNNFSYEPNESNEPNEPVIINSFSEKIIEEEIKINRPLAQPKNETKNKKNKYSHALKPQKEIKQEKIKQNESIEEKILRLRKIQEQDNMNIIADTFGLEQNEIASASINDKQINITDQEENIFLSLPETQKDFELLAKGINQKIIKYKTDYHYAYFVSHLLKYLTLDLESATMIQILNTATSITNQKIMQEKNKKKNKKKKQININREIVEDGMIEDEYDKYDMYDI